MSTASSTSTATDSEYGADTGPTFFIVVVAIIFFICNIIYCTYGSIRCLQYRCGCKKIPTQETLEYDKHRTRKVAAVVPVPVVAVTPATMDGSMIEASPA